MTEWPNCIVFENYDWVITHLLFGRARLIGKADKFGMVY